MAEPIGLFANISLSEAALRRAMQAKITLEEEENPIKIGDYFCKLLYQYGDANIFLLHHDSAGENCFCAYMQNFFGAHLDADFVRVLSHIAQYKDEGAALDYAIYCSTLGPLNEGYRITQKGLEAVAMDQIPDGIAKGLEEKFWSFSDKSDLFPDPEKAMRKRNYFSKPFKRVHKRYLAHLEEIEKPKRIAAASRQTPYKLVGDNYITYDNKVFFNDKSRNRVVELPGADPLSFRVVANRFAADKNHVYEWVLAPHSPPKNIIDAHGVKASNPKAIYVFSPIAGVDGASFNYIGSVWETIYWRDKNHIYCRSDFKVEKLVKLPADRASFKELDWGYARDKNHVFCFDKILEIDRENFTMHADGFLSDQQNVYDQIRKLPLDGNSFRVVGNNGYKWTEFVLEDKNGRYIYKRETGELSMPH